MTKINVLKYVVIMNNDPRFECESSTVKNSVIDAFWQSREYKVLTCGFQDNLNEFESKLSELEQYQKKELDLSNQLKALCTKLKEEKINLFRLFLESYVIPKS